MSKRVGVKNPGSRATLNEKQKLFAIYYLETEMISESVLRAGYQTITPNTRGTQLLLSPLVKAFIAEERAKRRKIQDEEIYSKIMSRAEILFEMQKIAKADLKTIIKNINNETDNNMDAAISSIKIKDNGDKEISILNKLQALKELDEHLKALEVGRKLEDSLVIDNALQEPEYE